MEFSALPGVVLRVFGGFPALAVFCTVFALAFDLMKRWKKCGNYPPGPRALPFLGNLLQVDLHNPHLSFTKLREKYGDVMSLDFGWTNVVVLSGYKTLKEALVKKSEDFADRPVLPIYKKLIERTGGGIAFARYGHWWKEQRKFSLSVMKNFGLGKKSLELRIAEEAEMLNKAFEEEKGLAFDPNFRIRIAVSNIICSIAFGHRFEYQDQKFLEFLHISEESFKMDGSFWGQLFNTFPFIHHLPGPHHKIFEYQDKIIHFLQEIVTEHKETWDANESRDMIDAFLAEHEKNKNNPKTSFLESNLIGIIIDIFTGGTGTISTTLLWALLFMVLHPDVQSQVHEEIDRVIGNGKKPKLEDREEMPFTNAVIHETQRLGNIGPISLPHQTYRDTEVMGYTIPKGTTIIPNITSALFDEDIWLTPHQFNPGHFLNSDGNFVKPEAFIPFSAGHRVCLGQKLAKTELFIFFTSLLQHFTFFLPENEPRPNFREAKYGIILCPLPYRLCAKTR
ncbi:cytochrome P450 2D6-like isoform X1 [Leucoraja erinacea]|uniref:cytochrome P450 2D6-like isoform X1 n=2 Tax=Leucoraja erinaceus TaxID=7782 RepID=UPI0024583A76|nr:cytochrome P450 2D6-like isoform X1 [Leucoraja erinacea]XP_055513870.1 cytochrome P450 2D6-like isoform X1 [Leucoraja erinacea]